jgi:hypothetical protein
MTMPVIIQCLKKYRTKSMILIVDSAWFSIKNTLYAGRLCVLIATADNVISVLYHR